MTVSRKFRQRSSDFIVVPKIMIEGKWLEELGFKQGDKFQLSGVKGRLVIRKG